MLTAWLQHLRRWSGQQQHSDDCLVQMVDSDQQFFARADETILQAALRQGIAWPNQCQVGSCASCKCQLVQGKVKQLTDSAYALSADELDQHYVLACQSVVTSPLQLRLPELLPVGRATSIRAEVVSVQPLTADIVRLRVRCEQPLMFRAGQYAELTLPGLPARPYSFAHACPAAGCHDVDFLIQVEAQGVVSPQLAEAKPGQPLRLAGPFGSFQLVAAPADTPLLLVAGGSGLAPLLSLLQQAHSEDCLRPVTLFIAARTAADLFAGPLLEELQIHWPGAFTVRPILSREPAESAWTGGRGDVGQAVVNWLAEQPTHLSAQLYVCGSPSLVETMLDLASRSGMAPSQLFADSFVPQATPLVRAAAGAGAWYRGQER